jgi:hypothetical protein
MTDIKTFTKETGFRFRVTKEQKARIELSKLSDAERTQAVTATPEELQTLFGLKEHHKWLDLVSAFAAKWEATLVLSREAAYEQFRQEQGLERLRGRKPSIPDEIFLQEGLTLENFSERLEALIGVKRRFRLSRSLAQRVVQKELTRDQAFAETVAAKRAAQNKG